MLFVGSGCAALIYEVVWFQMLQRRHDTVIATLVAAAINVTVAGLALALARGGGGERGRASGPADLGTADPPALAGGPNRTILIAIAISGLVALGSQVVWTRLMALSTPYLRQRENQRLCCLSAETDYNLLYGNVANVSSYMLSGRECVISTSGAFVWSGVPGVDLYFLLVGTNCAGTESSWGRDGGFAERNGSSASNECGVTVKNGIGVCP